MKIGFATTDGINVDEHFGRAGMFAIYEMTPSEYSFVETRQFADGMDFEIMESRGTGQDHDDLIDIKVGKMSDCKIIYLTEIGGPAAAKLVKKGVMPVKVKEPVPIKESMDRLLETYKKSPPPWMKKAMNS